jgi:Flp pilus assembly protein TadG
MAQTPLLAASTIRPSRIAPARSLARRFAGDRDGAAAVEFALVALPFLALVGAVLQIAFQLWASQNFDHALQSGVRTLLTGQFQTDNAGQTNPATLLANLKQRICGPTSATVVNVFNCQSVKIDVATSSTFTGAASSKPINTSTGTWNTSFGTNYACAAPGTIVVVTAAVQFPTFFNLLGLTTKSFTSGTGSGSGMLMSTAVFRTEPYQAAGASSC